MAALRSSAAQARRNQSILDSVMTTSRLQQPAWARAIARPSTEYLDSVREVERRISAHRKAERRRAPDARTSCRCSRSLRRARQADVRAAVAGLPRRPDARRHVHARPRAELPHLSGDRHHRRASRPLAPPGQSRRSLRSTRRLNTYQTELFAWFLDKLQSTPEGDGTLLDHSMFLYGASLSNPNLHAHYDLPLAVVGGGAAAGGSAPGLPQPRRR